MESFRNVLSQADSSDKHSITTTFAEVTEWQLVRKTRREMPHDFFISQSTLDKLVILHKKSMKFYKTLKEEIKTTSINSKRNSVFKRENSTTQIGAPQFQAF